MRASDISRVPGVGGWQIKVTIRLNDGDVKVIGHRERLSEIDGMAALAPPRLLSNAVISRRS